MWQLDGPVELLDLDERLTVFRQGNVLGTDITYENGTIQNLHPPVASTLICTVQPMNGRDLLMVPEAFRDKETLWLWARNPTVNTDPPTVQIADIVQRGNNFYQVQTSENWGSYNRCMLVASDVGPYSIYGQAPQMVFADYLSNIPGP